MIRLLVFLCCLVGLFCATLPLHADDAEVEKLAKGLKAKKPAERVKAVQALGKLGEKAPGAAKYLCQACADESKEVRQAALEALEKVAPKLYKPVSALVADKKAAVAKGELTAVLRSHLEASKEIAKLGEEGKQAVPLIYEQVRFAMMLPPIGEKKDTPLPFSGYIARSDIANQPEGQGGYFQTHFETLIKLAPDEKTVQGIGSALNHGAMRGIHVSQDEMMLHKIALQSLKKLAESNEGCRKPMVPLLLKALDPPGVIEQEKKRFRIDAIRILATCGPDAKDAIPALKKRKFDDDDTTQAVREALEKIDKQ